MTDEKLVSAEEARGLLDATGRLSSPVLFTAKRWMVSEEEAAAMSAAGDLFAAAPDLARTVIELHARAEQAERERDAARVFLDAEIGANVRWAAQAERDLLRRLWQRIDGEQDGDAPSAADMEDELVRLFNDMRGEITRLECGGTDG